MKPVVKPIYLQEYQSVEEKITVEEFNTLKQHFGKYIDVVYSGPGTYKITANQYVGNIVLKEHIIFIKPKVNDLNFSFMLLHSLDLIRFGKEDLHYPVNNENIVFELIVKSLLKRVEVLCKKGIAKQYYEVEENLPHVKERILIKEDIKYNLLYKNKIFCRYSDFGPDIIENRIIKYTLFLLSRIKFSNYELYVKVKRLLHYFEPISLISFNKWPLLEFNKLTIHYQPIINLCQLIISNTSLYFEEIGTIKFSSFLIDMDKLFEKFVFKLLQYELKEQGLQVTNNYTKYIDKEEMTLIKPDIIVKNKDNIILIIDTKYKSVIKDDDLNQMWIYCISSSVTDGVLVYPEDTITPQLRTLKANNFKVLIKRINLSCNSLQQFREECKIFIDDIKEYVNQLAQSELKFI